MCRVRSVRSGKERELLLNLNARPHISFQLTGQFSYLWKSNSSRTTDAPPPPPPPPLSHQFQSSSQCVLSTWRPPILTKVLHQFILCLNCWWTVCIFWWVWAPKDFPRVELQLMRLANSIPLSTIPPPPLLLFCCCYCIEFRFQAPFVAFLWIFYIFVVHMYWRDSSFLPVRQYVKFQNWQECASVKSRKWTA